MKADLFEFEAIEKCILCASDKQHDAGGASWQAIPFSYCICSGCGLKYMRPRPTPESYQRFYKNEYWQQNMRAQGYASVTEFNDSEADQLELRMPKYKRAYEVVSKHLSEITELNENTRIVEVGCAFGFTLEWLRRDFGCQVFGVEPSSEAVKRCEEGKVPIIAGTAEEFASQASAAKPEDKFDIVLIRHSLDCFAEPVKILTDVRGHLKDDGIFANYSVNVEYYDAMDPYHPYLYSPDTMNRLLALCGLEVFRMEASPSPSSHEAAVEVVMPSYEHASFARKAEPKKLPLQDINPVEIQRTHKRGAMVQAWKYLSAKDMMKRLGNKSLSRSKQKLQELSENILPGA